MRPRPGRGTLEGAMFTVEDRILHALLLLVVADGRVDDEELVRVRRAARDLCGFEPRDDQIEALLEEIREAPEDVLDVLARIRGMLGPDERRAVYDALETVARADGTVDEAERLRLADAARALGLDDPGT